MSPQFLVFPFPLFSVIGRLSAFLAIPPWRTWRTGNVSLASSQVFWQGCVLALIDSPNELIHRFSGRLEGLCPWFSKADEGTDRPIIGHVEQTLDRLLVEEGVP